MSVKNTSYDQEKSARQPPEQLVVGRVVRPHGVRGALVVESFSRLIELLHPGLNVILGDLEHPFEIENIRPHRKRFLITLDGIGDRNQAEQYRDLDVKLSYEDSEPLEEHEYYYWQILGMKVETEEGEVLGEVINIIETGANDVYVVESETGTESLIPAIEDVVLDVDLDHNRLLVRLLPGLLNE